MSCGVDGSLRSRPPHPVAAQLPFHPLFFLVSLSGPEPSTFAQTNARSLLRAGVFVWGGHRGAGQLRPGDHHGERSDQSTPHHRSSIPTVRIVAARPDQRLRDLAAEAQITERAAQTILRDLEEAGYVTRRRQGRRNVYEVHPEVHFRHPAEAEHEVGELLTLFTAPVDPDPGGDASGV